MLTWALKRSNYVVHWCVGTLQATSQATKSKSKPTDVVKKREEKRDVVKKRGKAVDYVYQEAFETFEAALKAIEDEYAGTKWRKLNRRGNV